ncbi:MAG TPA: aldolase/citrate lyase family protein [Terracidiphilus sp.]|nr:aldolase/citrate lyase family protein [Terracidiphilus sp.]
MTGSRVLRKLRAGEFVKTAGISRVTDPWIAEVVGKIGYDVIWFDLEHRAFGDHVIDPVSLACRATGIDLMVRIRKNGYHSAMQALEFGANGLMIPHIRCAEEARQWVEWSRFYPLGKRGLDGSGADADFGLADTKEYLKHANEEVFLAFQIEDKEAVESIEEIAAVPGFDLFFVGPADLSLSYGVPLEFGHPLLQRAAERVAEAARKHGKWWGIPTATPEKAQAAIDMGARMIVAGGDHGALVGGLQSSLRSFSQVEIH